MATNLASDGLPRRVKPIGMPASTAEWEYQHLAEEYNSLPVGDPKRKGLYEQMEGKHVEMLFD